MALAGNRGSGVLAGDWSRGDCQARFLWIARGAFFPKQRERFVLVSPRSDDLIDRLFS
jgi:hypothetical protein